MVILYFCYFYFYYSAAQQNKYPIIVPVPHEVFIRFPKIEGLTNNIINIHPVLFTQGINEQQTLAIAVGKE